MAKGFITREAGAVLNRQNKTAISSAFAILQSVLKSAGIDIGGDDSETTSEDDPTADKKPADTKPAKAKPDDAKTKEAKHARPITAIMEAAGFSWSDLASLLQNALNDTRETPSDGSYVQPFRIVDIFDDYFVYCVGWSGTEYYRLDYTVTTDGSVTLGTPIYVNRKVNYIAPAVSDLSASEAGAFTIAEDYTRLVEAAVENDGSTLVKLIAPGMGSSGYYAPDVLQRDGAAAFPKGTKMFWDHDTPAEESARPEGTLTRFAAVTTEDARYIPDHKSGAGLFARATVFEAYRDDLNEIAEWIGTSIRADGQARLGDYNGARVPIITRIKPSNGVNNRCDFVTAPGAGGRVLSLFESARQRQPQTLVEDTMTPEEIKKMVAEGIAAGVREAVAPIQTELSRLREAGTLREARDFADRTLAGPKYSTLPTTTRERIAGDVSLRAPLVEGTGAIDAAKYAELIEAAAKAEAVYLSTATGREITIGLGESRTPDQPGDGANDEKELTEIFGRWGHNDASAVVAARGRAA